MKVLLVKTSSLGDLVHTLPAVTEAARAIPDLTLDWVAEEALAPIPGWHPAVRRVIPIAYRRWRLEGLWRSSARREMRAFARTLREERYDCVIDAQGLLIKSAFVATLARGRVCGWPAGISRERAATWLYSRGVDIGEERHIIERIRLLFAGCLGYTSGERGAFDYGLRPPTTPRLDERRLVFLHGTTWASKLWPEAYWIDLARRAIAAGFDVRLPWGSDAEKAAAERIAVASGARVLPRLTLDGAAREICSAQAYVGVDTGLAHLGAAFDAPGVILFGSTAPDRAGALGVRQVNLKANFACAPCLRRDCTYPGVRDVDPPCFGSVDPGRVWGALQAVLREAEAHAQG